MHKPVKTRVENANKTSEGVIILGDPSSRTPPLSFGGFLAFPHGKRSALAVLGEELVRRGILSPGAH